MGTQPRPSPRRRHGLVLDASTAALLRLLLLLLLAASGATAYTVYSGTPRVSTTVSQLTIPPWYTRSQNMDWVMIKQPGEAKGDNLGAYLCDAAARPSGSTCDSSSWFSQSFPSIINTNGNPFNLQGLSSYNPFQAAATNQFTGKNDCTNFASCTSTQTFVAPAGGVDAYFAADIGYGQSSSTALLEMFIIENQGAPIPLVQYYSRLAGGVSALNVTGYTLFPASASPYTMINVLVKLRLDGGSSYQWGFRSKGVTGATADNWVITRALFGCVGPKRASANTIAVNWTSPSVYIDSEVTSPLADGSTIDPSMVRWDVSCNGPNVPTRGNDFSLSGFDNTINVGGVDADIMLATSPYQCTVTMYATSTNNCPGQKDMTLNIQAAPELAPQIKGVPAGAQVTGPYPQSLNVSATSATIYGTPAYNWRIDCGDNSTSSTASHVLLAADITDDAFIPLFNPYGNKQCNLKVSITTDVQGSADSSITTVTFKAPPKPDLSLSSPDNKLLSGGLLSTNLPSTLVLDAGRSRCANPPCSATVSVVCPSRTTIQRSLRFFNGSASITVGAGEDIDPTAAPAWRAAQDCTVTLSITDTNNAAMSVEKTMTVSPPISLPPGDITGLPPNGGFVAGPYPKVFQATLAASGVIGTPTYSWTVNCEVGSPVVVATASGPDPAFSFWAGNKKDVDPFTPYGNKVCAVAVNVSTATQGWITKSSQVTFLAPPVPKFTGAPYSVGPTYPSYATLDGSDSECANAPCTFEWSILCSDRSAASKDGAAANVTFGPSVSDDLDPTSFDESTTCKATLTITDSGLPSQTATGTASITPAATVKLPGGIVGLPGNGGSQGGPYPKLVNVTVNPTGLVGNAMYAWTLKCPPDAAMPIASVLGPNPNWSFWVGQGKAVDPFNPYGNKLCTIGVSVSTAAQGTAAAGTQVTFLAPPVSEWLGAPYTATPPYPQEVLLDASPSKCANSPCSYQWSIGCPGANPVDVTGEKSTLELMVGPGLLIDTTGFNDLTTCSVALEMLDSATPQQTHKTETTLELHSSQGIPGGITGLPSTGGAVGGPYPKLFNLSVNAEGLVGVPTYSWSIVCPPDSSTAAESFNSSSPEWFFWVGDGYSVDPFDPYGNVDCKIAVSVSTPTQGSAKADSFVTFLAPPVGEFANAPFAVGPVYPDNITMDAGPSECANQPCSYRWIVVCNGAAVVNVTGASLLTLSAGVGEAIDPTGLVAAMTCDVILEITDPTKPITGLAPGDVAVDGGQVGTVETTLTVLPPRGSSPVIPLDILGLPPGGGSVGGPYPKLFNVSISGDSIPPGTFTWVLRCPPEALAPTAMLEDSPTPPWSFWVGGPEGVVDPLSPYGNKVCNISATLNNEGPIASVMTTITFLAPPTISLVGEPYNAGPTFPDSVDLDARGSLCANAACSYKWDVICPGRSPVAFTGDTASVTVGEGSGFTINVLASPAMVGETTCEVTVTSDDSGTVKQTARATSSITIYPAPTIDARSGGPFTVPAGQAAVLDASNSTCHNPPCEWSWEVKCPGREYSRSGVRTVITTGPKADNDTRSERDIDTWALAESITCTVALTGIDSKGLRDTENTFLTVKPAPPDCNLGMVSVSDWSGMKPVTKPAACSIKQTIRKRAATGNNVKGVRNIQIISFKDPQGFDVYGNITAIITNQGQSACPCDPKCACISDAEILNGGRSARLIPLLTPRRNVVASNTGRSYFFRFTGISLQTGLTCSGSAPLCVAKRIKGQRRCLPFDATWTMRDATRCVNFTVTAAGGSLDQVYSRLGL